MRWLLSATRAVPVLVATGSAGAVAGLVRGQTAPMPSLSLGALAPVPVVAVLALVPAIAVVWGWFNLGLHAMAAAARPTAAHAAPVVAGGLVSFMLGAWVLGGVGSLLENGRNALGLLGLALLGVRLLGERGAVLLPIGFLFSAFLFGHRPGNPAPSWWAWILSDGGVPLPLGARLLWQHSVQRRFPGSPRRGYAVDTPDNRLVQAEGDLRRRGDGGPSRVGWSAYST